MRSRYSAFAAGDYKYIIKTTHRENPDFTQDTESWKSSIMEFCSSCIFQNLEIIDFIDGEEESYVTFKATLSCSGKDSSFTEKSRFFKTDAMWLYHSGEFQE